MALIQKVFGPKFHTDFPKLIREYDTCEKNGFFPSNVDRYGHDCVDLVVDEDAVVSVNFVYQAMHFLFITPCIM